MNSTNGLKIAVAIVLYKESIENVRNSIRVALNAGLLVIICDNNEDGYRRVASKKDIIYLKNNANFGISQALNRAINVCESKRLSHLLVLDQDSIISQSFISHMINEISFSPGYAIYFPDIFDRNSGIITKQSKYIITSGSIINIEMCIRIGRFDERYFIDCVDHEYSLRCRINGYKFCRVLDAVLNHCVGQKRQFHILGLKVLVSNHSPKRRYYMIRNTIFLATTYFFRSPFNIIKILSRQLVETAKSIVFEDNKQQRVYWILKGIIHGLLHHMSRPVICNRE